MRKILWPIWVFALLLEAGYAVVLILCGVLDVPVPFESVLRPVFVASGFVALACSYWFVFRQGWGDTNEQNQWLCASVANLLLNAVVGYNMIMTWWHIAIWIVLLCQMVVGHRLLFPRAIRR